jgi:hypothetical protein
MIYQPHQSEDMSLKTAAAEPTVATQYRVAPLPMAEIAARADAVAKRIQSLRNEMDGEFASMYATLGVSHD